MDTINKRRSIRKFSEMVVEEDKINLILKAAMQAPSARGQKPWHFLVIKDRTLLSKIGNLRPNFGMVSSSSFSILFMSDKSELLSPLMYPQDMSSSVTLALLEACSLGVGSCWCGVYPNTERMNELICTINPVYDIKEYEPFALVAFGYPQDINDMKFIDRFDQSRIHTIG